MRHSGGDSLLWTSATVTLYLEVELRRDSLPGTEQNTSAGVAPIPPRPSLQLGSRARMPENIEKNMKNPGNRAQTGYAWLDSFFSFINRAFLSKLC